MKLISTISIALFATIILFFNKRSELKQKNQIKCEYKGKTLYGKIKLVEFPSQADIKVRIVNSFPDLRVRFVENSPDECGEWQIVENNEDLKVYITESFPDLKIQPVVSFPGMQKK